MSTEKQLTAFVAVDGKQVKVQKGNFLLLDKRDVKAGDIISLDKVLLLTDEKKATLGKPYIKGASVNVEVLGPVKGKKITVLKKKRRKGYKVKQGARKHYINTIVKELKTK